MMEWLIPGSKVACLHYTNSPHWQHHCLRHANKFSIFFLYCDGSVLKGDLLWIVVECAQLLSVRKWTSVYVCGGRCVCPALSSAGLSPADLVPLSCDIIRAIFSLGQAVLSKTQTLWVTDSVGNFLSSQFFVVLMMQCACTVSGVKCRKQDVSCFSLVWHTIVYNAWILQQHVCGFVYNPYPVF